MSLSDPSDRFLHRLTLLPITLEPACGNLSLGLGNYFSDTHTFLRLRVIY